MFGDGRIAFFLKQKYIFLSFHFLLACCEQQLSCVGDSHCPFCLVTEQFLVLKWYHSIAMRTTVHKSNLKEEDGDKKVHLAMKWC